ncbi:MAG: hypothetical protein UT03_C0024G0007 [Candidatus Moranbacteria bacterium GW2011_GWD2_38_7]|nr:MAG: hypothetical protein US82_C0028G0020 [Parcubacteria group bacterium GW2011_GWC1_38_22]KKQ80445.1 MAG: hypothetical protein UT03_C0024G0007 [Candidatus Moranbacteria bacterium GW2011_GWD2_38_7]
MYKKHKSKKIRKCILCIAPTALIRDNLCRATLEQIVDSVAIFKVSPMKVAKNSDLENAGRQVYFLVLYNISKEKHVRAVVERFHFEVIVE